MNTPSRSANRGLDDRPPPTSRSKPSRPSGWTWPTRARSLTSGWAQRWRQPETDILNLRGRLENSLVRAMRASTASRSPVASNHSPASTPATGQPSTLRTVSPHAWRLLRPIRSSSSRMAGTSSITTQWSWMFWRSVTSARLRPWTWARRPMAASCSLVSAPPGMRIRSMKWPSSAGRWVYRPHQRNRMLRSSGSIEARPSRAYRSMRGRRSSGSRASLMCSLRLRRSSAAIGGLPGAGVDVGAQPAQGGREAVVRAGRAAAQSGVQAALAVLVGLPPPAPGPLVLPGPGRAGAGGAADRGVALGVQRAHRQAVAAHVRPDLLAGPVGERVELEDAAVGVVPLGLGDTSPSPAAVAAQAARPGLDPGQGPLQRGHLADVAAEPAQGRVLVEQVGAVAGDHGGHVGRVRGDHLDLEAQAGPDRLDDLVGLLGQAAGVQGQDPHPGVDPAGQVEHDHALGLEAGHHREPVAEAPDGPGQQLVGREAV